MNAVVGIIGDGEEDLASLMYVGGVLAVGFIGALVARVLMANGSMAAPSRELRKPSHTARPTTVGIE